jgi:glycosyltransferase involved in cell wall biosynthesis
MDMNEAAYVSVIIPTFNSAKNISACIGSVRHQTYPYYEILVVDSYSQDETQSIAETSGANVISCKGSQAAARNTGLAHSKGDFVLFLDSDQQLDNGVVENCVSICSNHAINAVKIPEVFVGLNFWGKCSALWKNSVVRAGGLKGGIPRFYKKQTLHKQLAFNDELRWWEDLELYQRLKSTGLKEALSRGKILHSEADSLQNAVRKYLSYGHSVTAFKSNQLKAPYAEMFRLTLSTLAQLLKSSGSSFSVFLGCLFLVTVKSVSATFGFLSRLK